MSLERKRWTNEIKFASRKLFRPYMIICTSHSISCNFHFQIFYVKHADSTVPVTITSLSFSLRKSMVNWAQTWKIQDCQISTLWGGEAPTQNKPGSLLLRTILLPGVKSRVLFSLQNIVYTAVTSLFPWNLLASTLLRTAYSSIKDTIAPKRLCNCAYFEDKRLCYTKLSSTRHTFQFCRNWDGHNFRHQ